MPLTPEEGWEEFVLMPLVGLSWYEGRVLHIFIHRVVLYRDRGCVDASQCNYCFYVHRADAKCRESDAGCIFKNASPGTRGKQSDCGNRRSVVRFLCYGCCRRRSKCWPGHNRYDVQKCAFGGHKFFKQVETLEFRSQNSEFRIQWHFCSEFRILNSNH